jgi:DNA-binding NtrC family response regulator
MVVLAPGAEIRASDIPRDILEGPGSLLPARINSGAGIGGGQEFEFFLRSLMELKLQVEELRRRVDGQERVPARMIEVTPRAEIGEISVTPIDEPEPEEIVYRSGMTMAEVEKAAIAAALKDFRGNRRRAAEQLGIGERTLYRKIRAYNLDS